MATHLALLGDNSINTAIRKIRRALGEDPEKPRYIETVLGKGYCIKSKAQNMKILPSIHPKATRKAISLNSNYSLAHLYLAHVLSNVGRHDEALETIQQARVLDPFSLLTNTMYGQF
jgi:DNA-binding winged helix-turn-helix (wHTH) protein